MRIDLGATVRTKDGHDAGKVHRVIIDPATERITGFAISTGGLLGREVIVGEDAFEAADAGGETVTLRLTKEELKSQRCLPVAAARYAPRRRGTGSAGDQERRHGQGPRW